MHRSVGICLLLLLAGCNAPVGGGQGEATSTETSITPAPIPNDTELAPGVTDEGVTKPEVLAEAHRNVIANQSYTLEANRAIRYRNGTVRSQLDIVTSLAENRTYRTVVSTAGPEAPVFLGTPPASGEFWSNGTLFVRRLSRDNVSLYNEFRPRGDGAGRWSYWVTTVPFGGEQADSVSFYRSVFTSVEIERVAQINRSDTVSYRLTGSKLQTSTFASDVTSVRDVRLMAEVTEDGLVRSLHLRYAGEVDGETVVIDWQIKYRDVGSTTVSRPPWFEKAVGQGE